MRKLNNILQLGIKELPSLYRAPALLLLILYAFTLSIYSQANSVPESPHRASIGVLDLSDDKGRRVIVPAQSIGYIDLGPENARKVGSHEELDLLVQEELKPRGSARNKCQTISTVRRVVRQHVPPAGEYSQKRHANNTNKDADAAA